MKSSVWEFTSQFAYFRVSEAWTDRWLRNLPLLLHRHPHHRLRPLRYRGIDFHRVDVVSVSVFGISSRR